jgi:hypothetical protein
MPTSSSAASCCTHYRQAGWHGAKQLRIPANISLLPLPPRAPELNSQENIWQFMRHCTAGSWGSGSTRPVWVPTVFTKNRERLLQAEVAHKFLAALLNHKEVRSLLSDEHFSVDGTQVAAWASMKSFRTMDGSDEPPSGGRNGERDFHGETRSNDTHASITDPQAGSIARAKKQGGQALLYRQCTDREPSRAGGRGRARLGDWNYRT